MSENTGIQITGLSAFASSLNRVQTDALTLLKQGLTSAAEEVIAESVQITPVDTGELRARAFTDTPVVTEDTLEINLGYEKYGTAYPVTPSGSSEEYAVLVHERVEIPHAVGQAKFLETALKSFEPEFLEFLGNAVKEVFQR